MSTTLVVELSSPVAEDLSGRDTNCQRLNIIAEGTKHAAGKSRRRLPGDRSRDEHSEPIFNAMERT